MKPGTKFDFLDVLLEVAGSIFGRIFLYVLAVFAGGVLGGLTGAGLSMDALLEGAGWIVMLPLAIVFSTEALLVAPLLLLLLFVFVRFELRMMFLAVPLCLAWYYSHSLVTEFREEDDFAEYYSS